ncbi:MAG TPA: serine/threonine-protein kinase [Solirubrobacteraceae bacterium]|nr:serine/threonine-protein kinase [Solirubrobacteraceae bacterium]
MTAAAPPPPRGGHATTSWQLAEGDVIVPGRRALRLLGGGRRHEAYLTWDEHLHALVVAKLLRPHQVREAAARQALATEAALLRELAHPLLLRSFGAVLDGPRPHLVLEHIEGPRLSTLIRRDGVAIEQLLPLGLEVVRLLRYLAAEEVVHLDIKPSNIIMAGRPRLIDLSVARRRQGFRLPGERARSSPLAFGEVTIALDAPVGTDPYMAPEQCEPSRFGELAPATDVWGLGATLFEALAGVPPFPPDGDRFPQLRAAPAPLPRHVPAPLAALVAGCLAPRPVDRPSLAQLDEQLQAVVARLPAPRLSRFRPGGAARLRGLEPG